MNANPISVVLVEDIAEYRNRTEARLTRVHDIECLAAFEDTASLLASDIPHFDILLLDVELGDWSLRYRRDFGHSPCLANSEHRDADRKGQ